MLLAVNAFAQVVLDTCSNFAKQAMPVPSEYQYSSLMPPIELWINVNFLHQLMLIMLASLGVTWTSCTKYGHDARNIGCGVKFPLR